MVGRFEPPRYTFAKLITKGRNKPSNSIVGKKTNEAVIQERTEIAVSETKPFLDTRPSTGEIC